MQIRDIQDNRRLPWLRVALGLLLSFLVFISSNEPCGFHVMICAPTIGVGELVLGSIAALVLGSAAKCVLLAVLLESPLRHSYPSITCSPADEPATWVLGDDWFDTFDFAV